MLELTWKQNVSVTTAFWKFFTIIGCPTLNKCHHHTVYEQFGTGFKLKLIKTRSDPVRKNVIQLYVSFLLVHVQTSGLFNQL
jgi:hypothetical protein